MRILSQEGLIFNDIPYEKFVLGMARDRKTDKFCIVASKESTVSESGYPLNGIMAEYSTEAKARKAMEMLRVSFENYDWIKSTGNSEELKQVARMFNRDEFKKMTSSYFQFPADDEVEV